jgi:transposase-like protein
MLRKRPTPTGKKKKPTGTDADINLVALSHLFVDEDKARAFLESKRWPDGNPTCPHCGGDGYALERKATSRRPGRKGLKKCRACRKQFTVRVGTIFEESKLPLHKWLAAIHMMTASKKGVSSHQIARQLDITQKSAWFLCHRIREAMRKEPMAGMLNGTVEVDESYIGGKPRPKNNPGCKVKEPAKRGRGTNKQPVMVLVERNGNSIAMPVSSVDAPTLKGAVRKLVSKSSTVMTDEWASYAGLGKDFEGGHKTVNHGQKEYVRFEDCGEVFVSTNTAESWFALLKRAHYGIHHQMSKKHLHRYCTERSFMWDNRKVSDGERMVAAIEGAEGKRLMYCEPTND